MQGMKGYPNFHVPTLLPVLIFILAVMPSMSQELSVEDVVARHLDSFGTKVRRDAVTNQWAIGTITFESKLPARKTAGKALMITAKNDLYFIASLASKEYPFEKIGYFNGKVALPFVTSGARSPLGAFLADHEKVLSDGLFGGSASSQWMLLTWVKGDGALTSRGTRKLDGKKAYVLEYFPKYVGTTEFSVRIFLDAETFRHIRTEYTHTITPKEATFGRLGQQDGTKITLIELFGDYREEDGLTLPHSYKIDYQTDSDQGTFEYIWAINVAQYQFNKNLATDFFTFDN